MVEKSTLSPQDKVKNKCTLTVGKCRGVYVLRGKRGKRSRRNIEWPTRKAHQITSVGENWVKEHWGCLGCHLYQARMRKRKKRTAAKLSRIADQNMSDRPLPKNCLSWAGRVVNGIIWFCIEIKVAPYGGESHEPKLQDKS